MKVKDNQKWRPTTDAWDGVNDFGGLPKAAFRVRKRRQDHFWRSSPGVGSKAKPGVANKTDPTNGARCVQHVTISLCLFAFLFISSPCQAHLICNNIFFVCLPFFYYFVLSGWSRLLSELPSLGQKSASKRSFLCFHTFQSHGNGNRSNSILLMKDTLWLTD